MYSLMGGKNNNKQTKNYEKRNSGSSHIAKKKSVQEKTMRLERIHCEEMSKKEETKSLKIILRNVFQL